MYFVSSGFNFESVAESYQGELYHLSLKVAWLLLKLKFYLDNKVIAFLQFSE